MQADCCLQTQPFGEDHGLTSFDNFGTVDIHALVQKTSLLENWPILQFEYFIHGKFDKGKVWTCQEPNGFVKWAGCLQLLHNLQITSGEIFLHDVSVLVDEAGAWLYGVIHFWALGSPLSSSAFFILSPLERFFVSSISDIVLVIPSLIFPFPF